MNAYSTHGYYFVTDLSEPDLLVSQASVTPSDATEGIDHSLDYMLHEQELTSKGFSGKDLLGEVMGTQKGTFDFKLPNVVPDTIAVMVRTALYADGASYYTNASVTMDGATTILNFPMAAARIYASSGMTHYNTSMPQGVFLPQTVSEEGSLDVWFTTLTSGGIINNSWLDYFIITYSHRNEIVDDGQFRMGFYYLDGKDNVVLPGAASTMEVWDVMTPASPTSYATASFDDGERTGRVFNAGTNRTWGQFVAFDPAQTLMKISGYETVANQDLHSLETPDMLIVTNDYFMPQAERLAQIHRDVDNMDVLVVDQAQIFNEFSSGTPDAMAVRLFCKMLYDRNKTKFKNLLMFGYGSFDNRNLTGNRPNLLITYETDNSFREDLSFASDDFFGILDDYSGYDITSEMLRLGVGRYTSVNIDEAKSDVDKLEEYITKPDYGPWRNNNLILADTPESNANFEFQALGINEIIGDDTPMFNSYLFNFMYEVEPPAGWGSNAESARAFRLAVNGKKQWANLFTRGQYFATYMGHGGGLSFTKTNHLWINSDVESTEYAHLPIMTTACCDVARYDSDERGIADLMFHKPHGGAIALLTSARSVYADDNDALNQAFTKAFFSYRANGVMPTLGEVYMKAKQSFGTSSNSNKMSFLLLGDPAIKINYPRPLFDITKINGEAPVEKTRIDTYPLQEITIEAQVKTADGSLDTNFNGDASITLYDGDVYFHTVVDRPRYSATQVERDVYYTNDELAVITGRVENGLFTGTFTVPRQCRGGYAKIRTYAHLDDSDIMVNGQNPDSTLFINDYAEDKVTVVDTEAPAIDQFYMDDAEQFVQSQVVSPASTIHIVATDNVGINVQTVAIGNAVSLMLDGSRSLSDVNNISTLSDAGRTLTIDYPVSGLTAGRHTLAFAVTDLAGNTATQSIEFFVSKSDSEADVTSDDEAVDTQAIFRFTSALETTPSLTFKVMDAVGNLVWMITDTDAVQTWDLKNTAGEPVAPGLYKFYVTYDDGVNYGGTPIHNLIVLEPLKTNK